jgi:AcrR family transcriptional regulator
MTGREPGRKGQASRARVRKWHDCHFNRKWQLCQIWHDGGMTTPPAGRREANKQATRAALSQAAARLFAEQGYEATTVTQIAQEARVGERTFYRYFDGKDDLLAEQALAWIDVLHQAIRDRPPQEAAYEAVAGAMSAVAGQLATDTATGGAWILTDLPRPIATLRRATPAPLRRLERSITDALLARASAGPDEATARLRAQLVARTAVAVLRTAAGRHRELVRDGRPSPGVERLLRDCFVELADLVRLPGGRGFS